MTYKTLESATKHGDTECAHNVSISLGNVILVTDDGKIVLCHRKIRVPQSL